MWSYDREVQSPNYSELLAARAAIIKHVMMTS